ncbi:OmpA family protein [Devosia lucknowensis]|uniref:OmpA family protein n=1 Tax=Devosia lucknowensis TaxID=1096929 RepID=A0A1Y6G600_9HYPH|nr:carbohydrate-binding domain-containing protein [Devosia lucknowensis]SMQ85506.1 OmpA family protein [Devosia lucknowensis]
MRSGAFFCSVAVFALSLAGYSARAGEISVTLSGTAFEGGPAFEMALGGTVVGSGTVENPVPEGQTFTFAVGDDLLASQGDLTLRLTNDYFAGEGQDRSLAVLSATVGATGLTPADFNIVAEGTIIERDNSIGALVWSENETAVANAPPGGWQASTEQSAGDACSASADVIGFATDSTAADVGEALSSLVSAAAANNCSVTITGYADVSGSELGNLRLTAARASAVLDDLLVAGARFPAANIVPTPGTNQFGAEAADNRRVTVQLWSPTPVAQPAAVLPDNPVSQLAGEAQGADLAHILVLGWRNDGTLYVRSSNTDPKEVLWLLEQAKARLIAGEPVLGPGH